VRIVVRDSPRLDPGLDIPFGQRKRRGGHRGHDAAEKAADETESMKQ
jgi:hypothetical protein